MTEPAHPLVIAITGAGRGIGLETARQLASQGHRLALADIDEDQVTRAATGLGPGVEATGLDVRDRDAFAAWLEATESSLGPLDVLVNNAGIAPASPRILDQDPDEIERVIAINLLGTVNGTLAAVRQMLPRGRGQVINVSSLAGLMGVPGLAAYAASKHGVIGFTESLRAELRGSGIDLSLVMPGPVATRMMDGTRTGPFVKLLPPERLGATIADLTRTRRARVAIPAFNGLQARLSGVLPPSLALRLSRLLRVDRIYTHLDETRRAEYSSWLHDRLD